MEKEYRTQKKYFKKKYTNFKEARDAAAEHNRRILERDDGAGRTDRANAQAYF